MQNTERDDHVERAETLYRLRRDGANDKRSTMTIALQGRGDIGGLDVVAMIIDALRKLVEDIRSAAADIEHPVSGIDLEKVTYQAGGSISRHCLPKLPIEPGKSQKSARIDPV